MKKILPIDDQKDNLTTIKAVIKAYIPDAIVYEALSGDEGLKMASELQPDVILLDIIMPVMDGYQTCEALKKKVSTKHIPIIMLTAIRTDAESRVKGLDIGADAFLSKPIDTTELVAQVNVMLRIKSAEDQLRAEKDSLEEQVEERTEKIKTITHRLQLATKSAKMGIWDLNLKTNELIWDQQMFELYGIQKNDLKKSYESWKKGVHPADIEQAHQDVQDAINGKSEFHSQFRVIWPDGQVKYIEAHATVQFDEDGVAERMIGVNWDITQDKLVENQLLKLSKAVNQSPVSIVITDIDGNIEYANPVSLKITCYEKEEVIGENPRIFKSGEKSQDEYKNLWDTLLSGKEWKGEFHNEKKNGELYWERATISPVFNEMGEMVNFLAIKEDITEQKLTREALEESENIFHSFMNNIPAGIFVKDPSGKYLFLNKYNEHIHNIKDWRGKTAYDFFPKEIAGQFTEDDQKVLKGEHLNIEGSIKNKDGAFFHYKNQQFRIDRADGSKLIGGISLDVTKEKEIQQEIIESERNFRLVFENSPMGIYIANCDGDILDANQALLNILGSPSIEATRKINVLNFPPMIQNGYADKFRKCVDNGQIIEFELAYHTMWGKDTHLHSFLVPLKNNQNIVEKVYTLIDDITERKKAERVRSILFNISNAVNSTENLQQLVSFIQAELGTIIDTTNFFIALYDEESETLSLPFFTDEYDVYDSIPAEKTLTHYVIKNRKSILADADKVTELVNRGIIRRVGETSMVWLGVPLIVEEKIIGVIAVQSYHDKNAFTESDKKMLEFISDQISMAIHRKNADDELKNALKKAEESDRLKSAFLANMSHEIRTPMNGIMGFASLLREPDLDNQDMNSYLDVIDRSGNRLLNIINDIIDISKIESGQMEAQITATNINEQMQFLHSFFKPETDQKGIQLSFIPEAGDQNLIIQTDKEKLLAVMTNLIKNAIKYSRKGSIDFGYNREVKEKEETLIFFVKDTGIGIPVDRQEAIFERFIQADIEDSQVFEGAGLGLAISKAFVEIMGGKIWLESEEGKGSTFFFTVPDKKEKK